MDSIKVKHGDNVASKIATESGFSELKETDEISVTGGGKVFGSQTKLSLKSGSIAEDKLNEEVKSKLNKNRIKGWKH